MFTLHVNFLVIVAWGLNENKTKRYKREQIFEGSIVLNAIQPRRLSVAIGSFRFNIVGVKILGYFKNPLFEYKRLK